MRIPLVVLAVASLASAEVADSSPAGFTVKQTYTIQAAPVDVYKHFFAVGNWWNSAHTYSHSSKNLSIEQKAGGCFCEAYPAGGGVKHMEVVHVRAPNSILLHGALGPLASLGVAGSMEIQLTAADGGTKLQMTYAVGGYTPKGMNTWAPIVDGMLGEQFTRLKNFVEHGEAEAKGAK